MESNQPFFSVIVPTYRRPDQLKECLCVLAEMDYPYDRFEVIIVDDGGGVSIEPAIACVKEKGITISVVAQKNAGPATARNTGAVQAKGEFLAFTDDDCQPATDWLQKLASRFVVIDDHLIGGPSNTLQNNLYSRASQLITDAVYSYYNNSSRPHFFASNNMAIRTKLFTHIGGFDTTFPLAASEDREFCDRWLRHGYEMTYAPEVVVVHAHQLTFLSYCRQHFNYGRGAYHLHQLKAQNGHDPIKFDISFYLNLFEYPFRTESLWKALQFEFLIFVQQTCKTCGFFWGKFFQKS